ncbi:uroporphyrinogen-III synthase [Paenibacillus sp. J2TS4]|uniref:uroporphyrinogen-III synthase n=1 Tax=Paenibacillus sp. J2TS4 TaxID=2807194 RepID=UPI001B0528E7|nr:uroporphyrinogen-III synthase [Paenibacillus sp. J2TS4]GIP31346.1 hypothetical protein J2TS4_05560 [Paenibacillus sp. J2TS4]
MEIGQKPLSGRRILVTRTKEQAGELVQRIEELGGKAVALPVIRLQSPVDPARLSELEQAIERLEQFNWIFFTSVNAVVHFLDRLKQFGSDVHRLHGARIAAVGPKTARALEDRGLTVYAIPERYQAEDLFDTVAGDLRAGQQALIPRSDLARKVLPDNLRSQGIHVTEIDIYENILCTDHAAKLAELFIDRQIDMLPLTSPSTFRNLVTLLQSAGVKEPMVLLSDVMLLCIGPVTARAVEEAGWTDYRMAKEATIDSLVEAMVEASEQLG